MGQEIEKINQVLASNMDVLPKSHSGTDEKCLADVGKFSPNEEQYVQLVKSVRQKYAGAYFSWTRILKIDYQPTDDFYASKDDVQLIHVVLQLRMDDVDQCLTWKEEMELESYREDEKLDFDNERKVKEHLLMNLIRRPWTYQQPLSKYSALPDDDEPDNVDVEDTDEYGFGIFPEVVSFY
jgi:hypothetical protein